MVGCSGKGGAQQKDDMWVACQIPLASRRHLSFCLFCDRLLKGWQKRPGLGEAAGGS